MDLSSRYSFVLIFFFFFVGYSSSIHVCKPASCNEMGPEIKFPFRLKGIQNNRCGYPGFDLSCNNQSQTILSLPASGDFVVTRIDYTVQAIYINDPDFCLPKRISKFDPKGSPFRAAPGKNYAFFNCSSDWRSYIGPDRAVPLFCFVGNKNYTVLATTSDVLTLDLPPSCIRMPNVSVPLRLSFAQYWSSEIFSEDIELVWGEPRCRKCELQRQYCGFSSDSGLEVGCSGSPPTSKGLPRSAKYGVIIGVGIPGLVCMIGLGCYTCGKIRSLALRRRDMNIDLSPAVVNPPRSISIAGLDSHTIESYPKTVLGESRRLPNPTDGGGTCPICLSEYQAKESLRTIPECNHFFHADCIDEWLKLNGTCPLCRNAPDSMTVTPCSSVSSIFSSSTSTA